MIDKSKLMSRVLTQSQKADLRVAQKQVAAWYEKLIGEVPASMQAGDIERQQAKVGVLIGFSAAFQAHEDDVVATRSWLESEAKNPGIMTTLFADYTSRSMAWWSARWAQCAFPVANMQDAKYAAALCTTTVPSELVEHVRAPWRAFLIRLPTETLLTLQAGDGSREQARRIMAHEHEHEGERVWSYVLTSDSLMVDRTCIPIAELCAAPDREEWDWERNGPLGEMTREDQRSMHMAGRIVVGTCMAFQTEGATRPLSVKRKAIRRRLTRLPTHLEFVVGKPINVDARRYVTEYIEGGGGKRGPITTQHLVRGHWKNQPHGAAATQRRFIHIEPYWRGPEDAPIAVRPHVLGAAEARGDLR